MTRLEQQFQQAMFQIYLRAKTEAGYPANQFLKMIGNDRGRIAAKTLINSPKPSDGYTNLHLLGRLDLTVEALVIEDSKWHELFTPEELERARKRLHAYGYQPK